MRLGGFEFEGLSLDSPSIKYYCYIIRSIILEITAGSVTIASEIFIAIELRACNDITPSFDAPSLVASQTVLGRIVFKN